MGHYSHQFESPKGIEISSICPVCNALPKSTDHSLLLCTRTKAVWGQIVPQPVYERSFNNSFRDKWISFSSSCSTSELSISALTCWTIWNDRNNIRLGKPVPDPTIKSSWVLNYLENWESLNLEKIQYS